MRIEALSTLVAVVWLTAVLCPRLVAANNLTLSFSSRRPREHPFREHISRPVPLESTNKRMTFREMQMTLRKEGGVDGHPIDCCPMVEEMSEPVGGRNRDNMYVELYRNGDNVQRFFEYSCKSDVLDKPCRFVDWRLSNQSRCVQKFSYTYAIVENPEWKIAIEEHRMKEHRPEEHNRHHHRENQKEHQRGRHKEYHKEHREQHKDQFPAFPGNSTSESRWMLDYIRVRSGCSCEMIPKLKKKKNAAIKAKKTKSKHRQPRDQEQDFETLRLEGDTAF
ncbi:hypothetical protein DMN91_000639 [Ooceraea biroi]|uniref:Spaetzle domain-containing protein n=1 Tax=Ooceraea biroi TaxID=2015173 RepID=A0A3L8E2U0_OOCBI|nr:uncharacterized protein LOC105278502 [Ooceraea biroi]RLU26842.1 hypothetical protein DMN91_000639 [Ooceraea biroi]